MKKSSVSTMVIAIIAAMTVILSLLVGCNNTENESSSIPSNISSTTRPSSSLQSEEQTLEEMLGINQEAMSGSVDSDISERIKALGLSSGDAEYLYRAWTDAGVPYIRCQDELFEYSVWDDGHISSGFMIGEARDRLREEEVDLSPKSEDEYITLAKEYASKVLVAFDMSHAEYSCRINDSGEITAEITITEIQGVVHVNSGFIVLSKGGGLLSFTGTNYSLKNFEGDYLDEGEIRKLTGQVVADYDPTMEEGSIEYMDLYMGMNGADKVVWVVKAQTPDSTTYQLEIDAATGDINFKEAYPAMPVITPPKA